MQELKEHVVKYKLLYSAIIFLVYIVGKNIPLYSINVDAYRNISFEADELLFQTIGGDFYRSSVFALGIFPSMISGLIVQIGMAVRHLFTKEEISPKKNPVYYGGDDFCDSRFSGSHAGDGAAVFG